MIVGERDDVLDALVKMGGSVCQYNSPDTWALGRCDCKYGAEGFGGLLGEQTGCPELRSVYTLVATMTDAEWADLIERSGSVTSAQIRRAIEGGGPDA
jgi:hypothetical protein